MAIKAGDRVHHKDIYQDNDDETKRAQIRLENSRRFGESRLGTVISTCYWEIIPLVRVKWDNGIDVEVGDWEVELI